MADLRASLGCWQVKHRGGMMFGILEGQEERDWAQLFTFLNVRVGENEIFVREQAIIDIDGGNSPSERRSQMDN